MAIGSSEWIPWVEGDEEKALAVLKKVYDHSIRTFDTDDAYSNGQSEILLGKFLKMYNIKRDKVVIMTKLCFPIDTDFGPGFSFFVLPRLSKRQQVGFENAKGLSRKHIMDAVQGSMERLGTYIDIYQIHKLDTTVKPKEIMKALNDCVEKNWVRYLGASTMRAVEFQELQYVAEKNNWHTFVNMQSRYNLLEREDEHEMNFFCDKNGIGLTPYFALAYGRLARPPQPDKSNMTLRESSMQVMLRPLTLEDKGSPEYGADVEIVLRVQELALKKNTMMSCIALAWLVSRGATPIVGINTESRVDDLVAAAEVTLTEEEIHYLGELYKPKLRNLE